MRVVKYLLIGLFWGLVLFGANHSSVKLLTYICDNNIGDNAGMIQTCLSETMYEAKTEKFFKFIMSLENNEKINKTKLYNDKVKEIFVTCEIMDLCEIKNKENFYVKNRFFCAKNEYSCLYDLLLYWKNKSVVKTEKLDINCEEDIKEIKKYLKINDIINCKNFNINKINY